MMAHGDLEPMSIGEILSAAMQIYWTRFGLLIRLAAGFVLPVEILSVILIGESSSSRSSAVSELALVAASQLATAACLKAVSDEYLGHHASWHSALEFVWHRSGQVLMVAIVETIVIGIGFLLLVVPGVYLLVVLLVATPALLIERLDPLAALQRSRTLIQGAWFRTAGCYLGASIFVALVALIPALIIIRVAGGGATTSTSHPFAAQVASVLTPVLATPFMATVVVLIYFDLRVRKERFTIEELARAIALDPRSVDRSRFERPDESDYPADSR
jgi:hypothetical protein